MMKAGDDPVRGIIASLLLFDPATFPPPAFEYKLMY
jgi:hypothetical protein